MQKKIYISGKITGLEVCHAKSIFLGVEQKLLQAGHLPVNPMKLKHDHDGLWESYMKVDIAELLTCDAIYLLRDWHDSKGACMEHRIAHELGLEIYFEFFTTAKQIPYEKL